MISTHINEVSKTANPIIKKFTELILHAQKVERPNLLPVICDLITNIKKQTGAQWSDNSKTMFALIRDFGGPALAIKFMKDLVVHHSQHYTKLFDYSTQVPKPSNNYLLLVPGIFLTV